MKKELGYRYLLFTIWAILLVLSVIITFKTTKKEQNSYYDKQIAASTLAKDAMAEIKQYKIDNGIPIQYSESDPNSPDIYNCGMIGERWTSISTTSGILEAKRTSCNPNFAALIIDFFKEAGVREGDEVAVITSGSFPSLNICVAAACQIMNLKVCNMASIGSSSFGANNPDFTYFDMYQYLYHKGIFTSQLDYVSIGGASDVGNDIDDEVKEPIIERIEASDVTFINESDYQTNVTKRKEYIYKKCPNVKLLINVGGSLVAMGRDEYAFISKNGLIQPTYLTRNITTNRDKIGLLDSFLESGIPVVQVLNIKGLAVKYGIPYDPRELPPIGDGDMYYQVSYQWAIPIIAIVISVLILGYFAVERYKIWKGKKI